MKNTISILFIFSLLNGFSQKEADKIILGGTAPIPPIPFKNNILYINENYGLDSVDGSQYLNMPLYDLDQSSSTFWKDSISYTSNGYKVVNQNGEIIVPKLYTESFIDSGQYMPLSYQNSLFINIKHDGIEKVFLLYGQHKFYFRLDIVPFNLVYDTLFYFDEFNPLNSNSGSALISKNNVILSETDSTQVGGIAACRHANGRDWWIIKPGIYHNHFYRFLFSPYGIETEQISTEASNERNISIFYCHFSADGNRYVILTDYPDKRIYLYDFDRCTGELSNFRSFDLNSLLSGTINKCCLSPDGSKMYIYRYPYLPDAGDIAIIQYDFETQQTYTIYQGNGLIPFTSPNGKEVIFFTTALDSNSTIGSTRFLNIIKQPNNFGVNCDINFNLLQMPNIVGFVPPNHANFRLGAAQGTVCDSLGLSALAEQEPWQVRIFPNPARDVLYVQIDEAALQNDLVIFLFDMQGRICYQQQINDLQSSISLSALLLPQGLYFYSIQSNKKQWSKNGKIAVIR